MFFFGILRTQNPIFIQKYGDFFLNTRFIEFRKTKNSYTEQGNLNISFNMKHTPVILAYYRMYTYVFLNTYLIQ